MKSARLWYLALLVAVIVGGVAGKAVADRPEPTTDVEGVAAEGPVAPDTLADPAEGFDPYLDMAPVAKPVKCDDLCRARVDCATASLGTYCGTRINPDTGRTQKCYCAICPAGRNCWH